MTTYSLYEPSALFAGDAPIVADEITLLSGQASLVRGTVLGKVPGGTAVSAVKASGANTGNGTNVPDASAPVQRYAQNGVYTLRCTVAGTNSATFRLVDPKGVVLGDYSFSGSGASVTITDQIKTVITDGSTDFIVGDGFDVTVTQTGGKYKLHDPANTDGSEIPEAILAADTDATSADVPTVAYFSGEFASEKLTYGGAATQLSVNTAFRSRGREIFVRSIGVLG